MGIWILVLKIQGYMYVLLFLLLDVSLYFEEVGYTSFKKEDIVKGSRVFK